jgi:streptogramin lyase
MRRGTTLAACALVACAALVGASGARGAPAVNGIYDLPGQPKYLTVGPDGNIWVTLSGSAGGEDVAKVTPEGVVTPYDDPEFNNPIGIASDGTDLWVTQAAEVVKFSPADPTNAAPTAIAEISDPRGITRGPDGNMWAASGDKLIRIPPANPATYQDFTITGMGARGISADSDSLWIADFGGSRIVDATTAGSPTFYPVTDPPQEVGAAAGVAQVAYASPSNEVGRITPGGAAMPTPAPGADPFGVAYGADAAWWFAQFATNDLGRLTADGTYTTLGGLPAASGPRYIAAGPNNTLWVGLETAEKVARVTGVDPPPDPPPGDVETTIDKAPKKVEAGRKGGKAKYKFSSDVAGATFECKLKRKGKRNDRETKLAKYAECKSPKTYRKLRRGRYTFSVRASAGGETDPTPATAKLRVKG